jgi:flagellar biosynthesis/type III secretory pathway protein FliH
LSEEAFPCGSSGLIADIVEKQRELARARALGEAVLEMARIKADRLIRDAEERAEVLIRERTGAAYAAGFEEGRREGTARAMEENRALHDEIEHALRSWRDRMTEINDAYRAERYSRLASVESELAEALVLAVESLVREKLDEHPERLVEIIRDAYRRLDEERFLYLRLNPRDLERLEGDALQALTSIPGVRIIEDARVDAPGFVLESDSLYVDGAHSTRIDLLRDALRGLDRAL